jgi:hypothetical protein
MFAISYTFAVEPLLFPLKGSHARVGNQILLPEGIDTGEFLRDPADLSILRCSLRVIPVNLFLELRNPLLQLCSLSLARRAANFELPPFAVDRWHLPPTPRSILVTATFRSPRGSLVIKELAHSLTATAMDRNESEENFATNCWPAIGASPPGGVLIA